MAMSREQRRALLKQHGGHVGQLPAGTVAFDFSTDSWAHLQAPYIDARMAVLRQRAARAPQDLQQWLAARFPFRHFVVTRRGRDAEALLFTALAQPDSLVAQNLLFHTARDHQQEQSMTPLELPAAGALEPTPAPFKGDLDLAGLERALAERQVSLIFVEALSNGAGGQAISLAGLRAIRALSRAHHVPLYLDATRLVENCLLIQAHEAGAAGHSLAEIMQALLACCDGMTASCSKDYGFAGGGLLATHSAPLFAQAQALLPAVGTALADADRACLAQALADWPFIETQAAERLRQTQWLGNGLQALGFPVHTPIGGHCVILDLSLVPGLRHAADPVSAYLAWLYEHTGMRGSPHWGGCAPAYQRPLWIRLAVPLGFPEERLHAALGAAGQLAQSAPAWRNLG